MQVKLPDTILFRSIIWFVKLIADKRDANMVSTKVCASYFDKYQNRPEVTVTLDLMLLSRLGPYRDSLPFICYLLALMEDPGALSRKQVKRYFRITTDKCGMPEFGILPVVSAILITQATKQEIYRELVSTKERYKLFHKDMMLAWEYMANENVPDEVQDMRERPEDVYAASYIAAAISAGFIKSGLVLAKNELDAETRKRKKAEREATALEQKYELLSEKIEKQKADLLLREDAIRQEQLELSKERSSTLIKLERAENLLEQREAEISELQDENKFLLKESDALLYALENIDTQYEESYEMADSILSKIDGRVVVAGIMEGWRNRMVEAFQKNGVDAVTVPPGQELCTLKKKDILILNIRAYKHSNSIPLRNHCITHKVSQVFTSATNFDLLLLDVKRQLFKEKVG